MPVMDGLAATTRSWPAPTPILILSANVDPKDSRSALCHKARSARCHGKTSGWSPRPFRDCGQLIQKVKFLARVRVIHHFRRPRQRISEACPADHRRRLLAIGASTGGPKAVMRLMKELPREIGAQVLIVQHIAGGFAAGFAEWLDRETP